ncbi:MAG: hypothetical protein NUV63_11805 [Gallionella sp.]|nr:hypothetical protein [Gallionella sp.]
MTDKTFSSFDEAHENLPGKITHVSSSSTLTSEPIQTTQKVRLVYSSELSRTGRVVEAAEAEQDIKSPIERVYPHLFDDEGPANLVRSYISNALKDAQQALESFGEADLESVGTLLILVATKMSSAHPLSEFNESLGAVVSYVRRATLTASNADITRSALNALVHVLQSASANPMLDLDEASDLVEKLTAEGWHGEHKVVSELVAALLDDINAETDAEAQIQMFTEPHPEAGQEGKI